MGWGVTVAYVRKKVLAGGARWYAAYLGSDGRYHEEGGFATKREAQKVAHTREVEAERGDWVAPLSAKRTFAQYVEQHYWPTTMHLEVSTRAAYRYYIDKHFLPRFGHMPMRRITATTVQAWVNEATSTLSARSVVKYHAVLHKIFSRAVIDRVVPYNPCSHSELPKVVTKPKRIITPEEFDAILAGIDVRYQTMVLLDIETGLRWGELVALRPVDIDFVGRNVIVRRVVVEVSKKNSPTGQRAFIKDHPQDDEQRVVQIEPGTCSLIREHMLAYAVRDEDLLFTSRAGTVISRNNFRTKVWQPAITAAGLHGTVTFHGLRAAHASWLLAGGADLQVVKERLGHRQIATTQQYLGVLPDAGERALAAFRKIRNR